VHLAATEAPEKAIARLEALRKTSDDPDVLAALGAAYDRAGKKDEATRTFDEARKTYDERLRDHAAAYGDHAARFFLGKGADPRKALALAKANAGKRPTEEAIDLWSAAAAANASDAEICASAKAMSALRYASEKTRQLATASLARCKP
jgi:tetratricopeptide (TPR) repeat protein